MHHFFGLGEWAGKPVFLTLSNSYNNNSFLDNIKIVLFMFSKTILKNSFQ